MHVKSYYMHGAVYKMGSNELVIVLVKLTHGRSHDGVGGKATIYLLLVVDIDYTCGLDGTQVLPRNGYGRSWNMLRREVSEPLGA